jgi:outer membrane biosynthesis protein TonB
VLAAALISWSWGKPVRLDAAVPVTIVANAPVSNVRPAVQAPVEAEALTEAPAPDATSEPVAPPTPAPEPAPSPKPTPAAKAQPKPAPTPTPKPVAKPSPPKKAAALDLDALAASLKPKGSGKPKSSAQKGISRAETAVQARPAVGQASALAASALGSLSADLARRWNPNCEVEGGSNVDIRVAFRLDKGGNVVGQPEASGENATDLVVKAASDRAKRAIRQAEPFPDLPPELYGERIIVRFNARSACATG